VKILTIIIPVFNEEKTIYKLLDIVFNLNLEKNIKKEIIIINDFSKDKSKNEIERFIKKFNPENLNFIENKINLGKGGSIKKALNYANGDYCIIQDADLE
jgi:Glycosyltransferases, probably involved in cell wall biogenesis